MSRLFLFGIGGTGARVVRSLLFLLANGMHSASYDEIVPVLIDPDDQNGDLQRTRATLKRYETIRKYADHTNGYFKTKVNTLEKLAVRDTTQAGQTFSSFASNLLAKRFSNFIDYNTLPAGTKQLMHLLYSQNNLDTTLTKGFLGNPNIGSVVLNDFENTQEFRDFGNLFATNDRIFLISSLFGGTGAAGFPLMLKKFRNPPPVLANKQAISESIIGAVTVLPYFAINHDDNSEIESANFLTKSIAALSYYEKNLPLINSLYYIGDNVTPMQPYASNDGGSEQKNNAHFVELSSALAVMHFMKNLELTKDNQEYFELQVKEALRENHNLNLKNLGPKFNAEIKSILIHYALAYYFFNNILEKYKDLPKLTGIGINEQFLADPTFAETKNIFTKDFKGLMDELKENSLKFDPLNLSINKSDLSKILNDLPIIKKTLSHNNFNYDYIMRKFNETKVEGNTTIEKLLNTLWTATETIIKEKFSTL